LIGVCGVSTMYGEGGKVGLSSLTGISKRTPSGHFTYFTISMVG